MNTFTVDSRGFYGKFGGQYVPELLYPNIKELEDSYVRIIESESFKTEYAALLKDYVGRPSPLTYASRLSEKYGAHIYLKREDVNHTGSHKINNTIGQILVAKALGKKRIIAETGAGQHGVATATVCALMNMQCTIHMGETDVKRQMPNVLRMKMLGAKVVPAMSGNRTLKDAGNEAFRDWIHNPTETHYLLGSVVGPHPYPDMVARFQAIISKEIAWQLEEKTGSKLPHYIIACVGGGSNAMGAYYDFIHEQSVQLIAVEAAGLGINTLENAASIAKGSLGVIQGAKTLLIQTPDGQIVEPYSISAGLDYPGIGPAHAYLHDSGRLKVLHASDSEALAAAFEITRLEGIIPAIESAHALAALPKLSFNSSDVVVVNVSGRGDKDMDTYIKHIDNYCKPE